MVVHPAPGTPSGTLVNALLAHCGDTLSGIGGERRPGIVHRIDRPRKANRLPNVMSEEEVKKILDRAGVSVARSLVGNYITSLDMAGCSVTLLQADDELITLWDAPVDTPGLRWGR